MPDPDCHNLPRQTFSVQLLDRTWKMERHGDLESLWEAMDDDLQARRRFAEDERLPYWTELWPSSVLLGHWLGQNAQAIRGQWCLDLGCGLGLSALAGASVGGRVLAMDYEWPAVAFTRDNARRNSAHIRGSVTPLQMDWRSPALQTGVFACVWAADVMYERRFAEPLAGVLAHALAPDGKVWIAEPGRAVFEPFVRHMRKQGWRCEALLTEKTPQVTVAGPPASVTIWELTRHN